jgi:TolB-like protein/DNA-binding winged helix-turn-helix (wHTH) protein
MSNDAEVPFFPSRPFRVGDWAADPASNRLLGDGTEVRLEPRVMALLVCLAQRPGEPVTREEIERQVWGRTVVGYDALTSSIIKLRKALGDESRQPRFIETVPKKGYRLIAPVCDLVPQADSVPMPVAGSFPRRRLMAMGLAILAVLAGVLGFWLRAPEDRLPIPLEEKPAIAVLPFANLGRDPAQDYLSEGITADITTAISKLSGLFVAASASARSIQIGSDDVKQAARTLGVRYILDGNVRRDGDRLRVNVQLVDAATGYQIWAERYDREMKDVLDVQDDITTKIASALSVKLTEAERQRIARRYTINIAAYDDFLRGQFHFVRGTPEENLQARAYFQQAIEQDPGFARAYGAMSRSYSDEFRFGFGKNPVLLGRALELANKAVALDDQLPQAYQALSYAQLHRHQYRLSIAAIERAIELDPNDPDGQALLALVHMYDGNYEKSVGMLRNAMSRSSHYPARYAVVLGQAYYFLGRYEDAAATLRDATERNATLLAPHLIYAATLVRLGKKDEAAWTAGLIRSLSPNFSAAQVSGIFPHRDPAKLQALIGDLKRASL